MSAKMGSTAPSPSIANLANKVISRLANNNNINNNISIQPSNHLNTHNNNNNDSTLEEDDDDSGDNDDEEEDAGIIRCICNYVEDDGFTIQCERCLVWQHAVCVGIVQSNVPDKYLCELCSPRPVDRKRANEIQRRRIGSLDRKREKSPSRKKPSVGRPRKPFGSGEQGVTSPPASSSTPSSTASGSNSLIKHLSKEQGTSPSGGTTAGNGQARAGSSSLVESINRKGKNGSSKPTTGSLVSSSGPASSLKQKPVGNIRTAPATIEDEDLDMESESQEDVLDAYQFEFSSVESNIVTSKAVQDLFRQVIAQFRQAQSRKRSLSLTTGVKLQELVASSVSAPAKANDLADNPHSTTGSSNINNHLAASMTPSAVDSPNPSSCGPGATTAGSMDASNVVSMERESLARPLMRTTVKHILSSSKLHPSPAPQYGLFADSNISAGRFMLEFKGEVLLKSAYKVDPINQYSILATPKPFVLFHPQLNLAVDARRSGNDARFVRRSCLPNTEVKSIVVPGLQDQTVHLGLFAKVPIGKGQEITLDWDWNWDHLALQSLRFSRDGIDRKISKDIRKAKYLVASTLFAQTDCACEGPETCVLHRMWKDGTSDPARELDSTSKGNRPKKAQQEPMRQRHKLYQDTSGFESQDGKRSTSQDSSEDELSPAAETSPQKKPLKTGVKVEGSSKKARHDLHGQHRGNRWEEAQGSDSNSDDSRRRKQSHPDQQGSVSRRASNADQEMSAREMKHALQQIKKMEDKDLGRPRASISTSGSKDQSLDGQTKRSKASQERPENDQEHTSPTRNPLPAVDDGNISIGDSGIDSDSNNGNVPLHRAQLAGQKKSQPAQGKRVHHSALSQSSTASDSDLPDTTDGQVQWRSSTSTGKKQPYAAASRGRRIAEQASGSSLSKDHIALRQMDISKGPQGRSGSSSVETSFVSVVGNTSDEEEERAQKSDRRHKRYNTLQKATLPVPSPKPSVLPCKKLWKLIYMKQRAVAEEEAREKAEEMRRKAEEVFDLKMEEDEAVDIIDHSPTPTDIPSDSFMPHGSGLTSRSKTPPTRRQSTDASAPVQEPSMVPEDILNLFNDDVKPESGREVLGQHPAQASRTRESDSDAESTIQKRETLPSGPTPEDRRQEEIPTPEAEAKTPQRMSLESYQAQRRTEPAAPSQGESSSKAPVGPSDVEMVDANVPARPAEVSTLQESKDSAASDEPSIVKTEASSAPKMKLSLQDYMRQRQEASLRIVPVADAVGSSEPINPITDVSEAEDGTTNVRDPTVGPSSDIVMAEPSTTVEQEATTSGLPRSKSEDGDYFKIGDSLPTPLIGLSSSAQTDRLVSSDYFPLQPFSPTSLSVGTTPFSGLNLSSSPPHAQSAHSRADGNAGSPVRSPIMQRHLSSSSPNQGHVNQSDGKSPSGRTATSSTPTSPGWRTPRAQRAFSPFVQGSSNTQRATEDGRLTSPRYQGSLSERLDRPPTGSSSLPQRERQLSLTSGHVPSDVGYYGPGDELAPHKRSGPLFSPSGQSGPPQGPRDYYKDDRSRHRSLNGDEWGYNGIDNGPFGGYRGSRGAPPPPRDRERDRERDWIRDNERDWNRDGRDRYDRRGDYPTAHSGGGNSTPFYGPNRGPAGQSVAPGGVGRHSSDHYGPGRDEGYHGPNGLSDVSTAAHHSAPHPGDESVGGRQNSFRRP